MLRLSWLCAVMMGLMLAPPVAAQPLSLFQRASLNSGSGPLVDLAARPGARNLGASLFVGRQGGSLFAPVPPREKPLVRGRAGGATRGGTGGDALALLRALIGRAEAGRAGYDAVQHGAKIKPAKRPTQMTLQEIFDWIKATPGQMHAIGRYQFIPNTLRGLVVRAGVPADTVFSPALQDRLADMLLRDAGLADFRAGRLGRHAFMYNLAKIWAGLPTSTGASYYAGLAGNRSTITWVEFDTAMARIFPDRPPPPQAPRPAARPPRIVVRAGL